MAISSHVEQLKQKHNELDAKLQKVMSYPSTSAAEVNQLKRQKLKIKDKISELRH